MDTNLQHAKHSSGDLENGEYVMIDKIEITNFRCFKSQSIGGLKKFNVLVGPSGSGKTALLEALFLVAGGSAEIYYRLRGWRGLGVGGSLALALTGTRMSYESMFRELFFGFDNKASARVEIVDSKMGYRRLSVSYKPDAEYELPLGEEGIQNFVQVNPIVFSWKTPHMHVESKVQSKEGKLQFAGTNDVYPIWLISPSAPSSYAQHFSDLSKKGESAPVVEEFCKLFPIVKGISLESSAGQMALFVELSPFKEKMPIGMISAGMNKYLEIMVSIASNPGGVVLIDEIENGFYYESLTMLLRSVCRFAEEQKVQLIATTHSYEFLESFASVMGEGKEQHFNLLRSSRNEDGSVDIRVSRGPSAKSAIVQHFEVR
ncbi:MAG TPA: AAA family ATPase [Terriglobia bacterium]|nr:AAA family ATPase [Terriglobia bacterium]